MLLRVIFTVGFAVLAIRADEDKRKTEVFIYVALTILFQPLLKIPLGRSIWNIVDVIVAVGLVMDIGRSFIKTNKYG